MGITALFKSAVGTKAGLLGASTSDGLPEEIKSTGNSLHVYTQSLLSGENQTDDRLYGGNAPASKIGRSNSGAIKASPGKYYGYIVITAIATDDVIVYDNTSATGNAVDRIISGTEKGTHGVLASPVPCSIGMYASFGGTGSVLFLFT